jgi:hypothetical protein
VYLEGEIKSTLWVSQILMHRDRELGEDIEGLLGLKIEGPSLSELCKIGETFGREWSAWANTGMQRAPLVGREVL